MKKVIASIAAAGVLVAGAFIASAVTGSEASAQTDETTAATDEVKGPQPGRILDGVLSDLVEDGTLNQDQADAVKEALVAKHEEIKDKYGDRRERRHDRRELISEWLEDGVISADELADLDVDLPKFEDGPLADALEDGQITQEEWDDFVEERKADREARREARSNSATN